LIDVFQLRVPLVSVRSGATLRAGLGGGTIDLSSVTGHINVEVAIDGAIVTLVNVDSDTFLRSELTPMSELSLTISASADRLSKGRDFESVSLQPPTTTRLTPPPARDVPFSKGHVVVSPPQIVVDVKDSIVSAVHKLAAVGASPLRHLFLASERLSASAQQSRGGVAIVPATKSCSDRDAFKKG
jgi:hypothetical protein